MDVNKLSSMQLDALREIGNIGAGNAVTSMSELIGKRVDMNVPSVSIVTYDEMMDIVGGPDQTIVAMLFRVHGEATGTVYFILTIEEAELLVSEITNQTSLHLFGGEPPDELAISALKEAGNIIIGSYLAALSDFFQINMQSSIPYLSVDMAAAILTIGLIELSEISDYAIVINTEMNDKSGNTSLHGHFFFLPDLGTLPKLFTVLGINDDE